MIYLIICALLQGLSKAVSDTLDSHHSTSIFSASAFDSFFGVDSWKRKYKNGEKANGEKFPLSTSLLVFLTDGWHASNTVQIFSQLTAMYIAFSLPITYYLSPIILCAGYWAIRTGVFHVVFTYVLIKKNGGVQAEI